MKNLVKLFLFIAVAAIANISLAQDGKNVPNVETMTPGEVIKYLHDVAGLSYTKQSENYFLNHKYIDSSKVSWPMIRNFSEDLDVRSSVFKYLLDNRIKFYGIFTADYVDQIIREVYCVAMNRDLIDNIGFEPDTAGYKVFRSELVALKLPSADRLILGQDLALCEISRDWRSFAKTAVVRIESYCYDNYQELNYCANTIYEHVNDTVYLNKALCWSQCSLEINLNSSRMNTYASLLYKLGRKTEAQDMERKAIELAKKEGGDSSQYEESLTNMQIE